jgi:uncharacterized protein
MKNPIASPLQARLRDSYWLVLLEFVIVAALFAADVFHHLFLSKTPYLFLLGWVSLRLRGLRWKDVGFASPPSWGRALAIGASVGIGMELLELFVTQPLLARLLGKMPDLSDFSNIVGNFKMLLFFLVLIWTLGVLGEEVVYRGYLMNRVADLFRKTNLEQTSLEQTNVAWIVSLVVVSVVFGCGHLDQGATGMIENVWNGLLLGALYLACGRNLAVPLIAHATTDTIDLVIMYLGKYPGLR